MISNKKLKLASAAGVKMVKPFSNAHGNFYIKLIYPNAGHYKVICPNALSLYELYTKIKTGDYATTSVFKFNERGAE